MENKSIETNWRRADVLQHADPERIIELINKYPMFRQMYGDVYEVCRNMEKVMGMYSKELQELDRNTVQYMIDEMQETIDAQKQALNEQSETIKSQAQIISEQKRQYEGTSPPCRKTRRKIK